MLHLMSSRQFNDYIAEIIVKNLWKLLFYGHQICTFSLVLELFIFFHWLSTLEHSKCFILKAFFRTKGSELRCPRLVLYSDSREAQHFGSNKVSFWKNVSYLFGIGSKKSLKVIKCSWQSVKRYFDSWFWSFVEHYNCVGFGKINKPKQSSQKLFFVCFE
jgi:hypothetical protein